MDRSYCVFRLDRHYFGLDVCEVQEVISHPEATAVPLSQDVVRGLISLRGEIVPAVDLNKCLELDGDGDVRSLNVIIATKAGRLSLQVDEICDVRVVADEDIETSAPGLTNNTTNAIKGAVALEDRILLLLDMTKLLEFVQVSV